MGAFIMACVVYFSIIDKQSDNDRILVLEMKVSMLTEEIRNLKIKEKN